MRMVFSALWLVVPLLVALLLLVQAGAVTAWAACVLALLAFCVALAFALAWRRDLVLLGEMLRRIGAGEDPAPADAAGPVLLRHLAEEAQRTARRLAGRAAVEERNRRADGQVLDR